MVTVKRGEERRHRAVQFLIGGGDDQFNLGIAA